eukprot:sb/3473686/
MPKLRPPKQVYYKSFFFIQVGQKPYKIGPRFTGMLGGMAFCQVYRGARYNLIPISGPEVIIPVNRDSGKSGSGKSGSDYTGWPLGIQSNPDLPGPDLPEPRFTGRMNFPRYRKITVFYPYNITGTPIYRAKRFPPIIPVNRGSTLTL